MFGIGGNDGELATLCFQQCGFTSTEIQPSFCFVGAVALQTVLRQQWLDVSTEIDLCRERWCRQRHAREAGDQGGPNAESGNRTNRLDHGRFREGNVGWASHFTPNERPNVRDTILIFPPTILISPPETWRRTVPK